MLRITQSFLKDELAPLGEIFSIQDIHAAYIKGVKGLGNSLGGIKPPQSKVIKVYLTSKTSPARILFAFFITKDIWIPLLLRDKNDRVGRNLSPENTYYTSALVKALDKMEGDILEKKFEDFRG